MLFEAWISKNIFNTKTIFFSTSNSFSFSQLFTVLRIFISVFIESLKRDDCFKEIILNNICFKWFLLFKLYVIFFVVLTCYIFLNAHVVYKTSITELFQKWFIPSKITFPFQELLYTNIAVNLPVIWSKINIIWTGQNV